MTTTTHPTKAYVVKASDDEGSEIVFANNSAAARRYGAKKLGMDSDEVEFCRREPEFDKYAPGPVPLSATLPNGWWHSCASCSCTFDEEGRREYGSDDDRDDECSPVTDAKGLHYCSHACMMQGWADQEDTKRRQSAAIEATCLRWPDATNIVTYRGGRTHIKMRAVFRLPGVSEPIDWVPGESVVLVAQRSANDFRRLYGISSAS
jgi:hypothetical protein